MNQIFVIACFRYSSLFISLSEEDPPRIAFIDFADCLDQLLVELLGDGHFFSYLGKSVPNMTQAYALPGIEETN